MCYIFSIRQLETCQFVIRQNKILGCATEAPDSAPAEAGPTALPITPDADDDEDEALPIFAPVSSFAVAATGVIEVVPRASDDDDPDRSDGRTDTGAHDEVRENDDNEERS